VEGFQSRRTSIIHEDNSGHSTTSQTRHVEQVHVLVQELAQYGGAQMITPGKHVTSAVKS
jgi:hypothetical protein